MSAVPQSERPELSAIREHMIIGGKPWAHGQGEPLPVYDPATGKIIAHQAEAGPAEVDAAVRAARQAFEDPAWRDMPPVERERLLLKLADLVEANGNALARLETLNNGKLLFLSQGLEVGAGAQWLRYMAGWATKISGETLNVSIPFPPGLKYQAYTRPEPVGVVGAIVPWNFPLLMAIWKIAPAVATGCTVVLKPAEETPLTAIRLAELALEAGFPPGVINVITGRGEVTGAALVAHPGLDKIAFTGSTEVGKLIGKQAMDDMKRVSLELGGKSPVVILDDCPIEQAVQGAAGAIFFNQGQVCTAGSRLFVQRGIYEEVVSGLAELAAAMKVGSGLDPETQIGPMVSARHRQRVLDYIASGKAQGARVLAGGTGGTGNGYFVLPTVFADAPPDARICREEIFGPVVVAAAFDTLDDAVAHANDTRFGLGASIWSNDLTRVHQLIPRIQAGTVWVNTHNMLDPHMPFGGYKESGIGREHGRAAIDMYLEKKSVCMAYPAG
ncbi:aldehyde dehydrogenase family protein [Allopusillimonas soli]|uniref:Aldehyde dehydrogenase family protein n=1 Tax=Allopusillimonas soli TaxID=659016 RepID=A0A853F9G3_9BURK|nr:aldehyde dehydrogenase family protein [Allopusillimonas soli]NYT37324.1 aldehyde dehydrogenase family protein [Allopusillimonas soli]TEA74689.1 aldehyde dehydrogenase family protein [Allopusillimonas soli]